MRAQVTKARNLILAAGLALAWVAALLWCSCQEASRVQAAEVRPPERERAYGGPDHEVSWEDWCSGPYTSYVPREGTTWSIPECSVVITFPFNAIFSDYGAVFTFTPEAASGLESPLSATPYFFEMGGTYSNYPGPGEGRVSLLRDVSVEIHYDDNEIRFLDESTLGLYYYSPLSGWLLQSGVVDHLLNVVIFETRQTGQFGLAGYAGRMFLPVLYRGAPAQALEEGEAPLSEP